MGCRDEQGTTASHPRGYESRESPVGEVVNEGVSRTPVSGIIHSVCSTLSVCANRAALFYLKRLHPLAYFHGDLCLHDEHTDHHLDDEHSKNGHPCPKRVRIEDVPHGVQRGGPLAVYGIVRRHLSMLSSVLSVEGMKRLFGADFQ